MRGPADTTPSPDGGERAAQPDRDGGSTATAALDPRAARYVEIERSPEFQDLKSRHRRFVFPVTLGALAFYFTYVLCAAYAPDAMAEPVIGKVNVGIIFGLLQFVMTFAITWFYVRYARTVLDPRSEQIRTQLEREEVA